MAEVIWDKPKEVPEWVIETVNDNVIASSWLMLALRWALMYFELTVVTARATIWDTNRRYIPTWSQLLDANSCHTNPAGGWFLSNVLPQSQ